MSRCLAVFALLTLLAACGDDSGASPDGGGAADGGRVDMGSPSDPCEPNPCTDPNRGVCVAEGGSASCDCDPGFEEAMGECMAVTECGPDTCSGHGTCSEGDEGPECACELGYAGTFCDGCDDAAGYYDDGTGRCTLDACTPNPCEDDPTRRRCVVEDMRATCVCNAGTHEEDGVCVPDTTCTDTTCSGNGTCTESDGMVSCACDPGWAGSSCDGCDEVGGYHPDGMGGCTMDDCLPNPCTEPLRSVCSDDGGSVSCSCDSGAHLEGDTCVPDEVCEADTCSGHGECAVVMGVTECTCDAGHEGADCASCASGYHPDGMGGCTMDPCLPNPCTDPLQTVCVAMGATPVCECDAGAHPDGMGGCTTDPCLPDMCAGMNMACRVVDGSPECYTPECDDGNPCTDDAVVAGACQHTNLADGTDCSTDICLVGETCMGGTCGGGSARVCDDGNPCTADFCDSPGGCGATNDDTLVPPDDGIPCTEGVCSDGAASHVPTDANCDDGLYCNGEEVCAPGASADADGCVTQNVPTAPGMSTPCASWRCDEAMDTYVQDVRGAGESCDDGVACTTGDTCNAAGVCTGAITGDCGPPTGMCSSTTPLGSTIDIGVAPVTGTITQNGAELPLTTPDYENGVLWARAQDTGVLHRLKLVNYRTGGGSYPTYMRSADADQYTTLLVPGVYDLLWERNYDDAVPNDYVQAQTRSPNVDPVVNGFRVLQTDVLIPAGGRTLDVDIRATEVSGTITQNGAELPLTTPDYENGVLWARAQDTGVLHRLKLVNYRTGGGSYPTYMRSADADQYTTLLIPGTYDLLWERSYDDAVPNDYVQAQTRSPNVDPVVNGFRVLRTGVVISGTSQTVNVDIDAVSVSGTITQNGELLPMTTPDYENGVLWFRSRDTGVLHRGKLVNYRTGGGSYPTYRRSADADQYTTLLIPGAYDLLWERSYDDAVPNDYVQAQTRSPNVDPVVNGFRILQQCVLVE